MGIVTRVTTRRKREWLKRERCILNSSSAQNKITLGWGSLVVICRREERVMMMIIIIILNSSSAQNKITLGWGSLVMCRREETSGPVKEGKSSKKYDFDNKSIGLAGLVTI